MPEVLNFIVTPTYDVGTIAITDASVYTTEPPNVTSPFLEIVVPSFGTVYSIPFTVQGTNVYNSTDLGITVAGSEEALPDGVYCIKYTVNPPLVNYVEHSIMRVDRLQEMFDEAFMRLDMMECDKALKTQQKVELNTIYFLIQGAVAAANNCANVNSLTLYTKAYNLLVNFMRNDCGCSGNNYITNFGTF